MQRDQIFNGTIPGFNDTRMQPAPVSNLTTSVNINPRRIIRREHDVSRALKSKKGDRHEASRPCTP